MTIVVVACLVAGTVFFTFRKSLPDWTGTVAVPGLSSTVHVYRDSYGVPQIYADNADDLFKAEGYLHATDRFWEMDFRRHVTAGRLSELFGKSQVDTDKYIRTMGWRRVAEQELPLLSPQTRSWLESYAAGVNAWISEHQGTSAGVEYAVLKLQNSGYRIEKWSPVDSLAWLKAMAWDLRSNMSEELERARLLAAGLTWDQINELFPAYPYQEHPPILKSGAIVDGAFKPSAPSPTSPSRSSGAARPGTAGGGGGGTGPDAAVQAALSSLSGSLEDLGDRLNRIPQLLGIGDGLGSNSWVVSGTHTTTGKPLLANDPHLGPVMPSIWYQIGLHCTRASAACPVDVSGFGFSGVPGIVIGHNARIAWGFTNLGPDVADLYLEKVDGNSYERDGDQVPLVTRTETIKVAGGDDVRLTIRSTVHGPLLSDQDADLRKVGAKPGVDAAGVPTQKARPASPAYAVALQWTALTPGRTADALFALNTAQNFDQFRAAARNFAVPAQNMIYADVDGNIGYQAPGTIPVRGSGDGLFPVPGWNPSYDWAGSVPFEQMPYAYNPPAGYVVTANQAPVAEGAGPILGYDWDYGYRSSRIEARLQAKFAVGKIDAADMSEIQMDTQSGIAKELVPLLEPFDSTSLLKTWDYNQTENSAAAAYFNAVWRALLSRTFDELPADLRPDGGSRWFEVVSNLLRDPTSPWWDRKGTAAVEKRDDILRLASSDAVDELTDRLGDDPSEWRWGDLHTLTIRNQSFGDSGIGLIEAIFNRGPYKLAGGSSVVDATGSYAPDGYQVDWVPSMRMVVDLADLDRSRWVNLTGESGHPFSDHYSDQVELWRNGETTAMRWRPETIRSEAKYVQNLTP
ncbi:penicillin acylase family protein [Cryptosporangium phraense]|uniref:Penicillin acylase family protein n=1 Tax=Cryptosporangium phraense TaxID=2593070 RepID=A0A545AWT3_9ACTN|nr:penicillin acylase family protein [Cryptosporangium phraense]